jgi:hypothetical protein
VRTIHTGSVVSSEPSLLVAREDRPRAMEERIWGILKEVQSIRHQARKSAMYEHHQLKNHHNHNHYHDRHMITTAAVLLIAGK